MIGGGNMGAGRDCSTINPPQTHAGGYLHHNGFDLVAICDSNPEHSLSEWGCSVFSDIDEMLEKVEPDVVSVAVPGPKQYGVLQRLLEFKPKAVIAEKPLSMSLDESVFLSKAYVTAGIPLIVNYSRRFVPLYSSLACHFSNDEEVVSVVIKYAKGLIHNGLHAIDLARQLFGEVKFQMPLVKNNDYFDDDPSLSAFLIMERAPQVFLISLDENCYTHFELDIYTNLGRYVIDQDHRRLKKWIVKDGEGIPKGKRLVESDEISTGHEHAIINLVNNLYEVLEENQKPFCSGTDAIAAQHIAEELIKSI